MLDGRGGLTYGDRTELLAALEELRTNRDRRDAMGRLAAETYELLWTPERHLAAYFSLIADRQAARRSADARSGA